MTSVDVLLLVLVLVVGLAVGAAVATLLATSRARGREAALQAAHDAERRSATERVALLERSSAERRAVEDLVAPVASSLAELSQRVADAERARAVAQAELRVELGETARGMAVASEAVRRETGRLSTALGRSEVRGRWGEVQLRRLVEVSGLLDRVHFTEQDSRRHDDGVLRPDMVVHLADDKHVVVDAKVPLHAFLDAEHAADDTSREAALDRHAAEVAAHVDRLAAKEYWRQYDTAPEFVVLFLPAESLLGAALVRDPGLLDRAFARSVVLATPTTLLAMLRTVAHVWRQEAVAANAREIQSLGRDLHDRLGTLAGHLVKLGSSLDGALGHYNRLVASLEGRVLVSARRLSALGVSEAEIPTATQIDHVTRRLQAEELVAELDREAAEDAALARLASGAAGATSTLPPGAPSPEARAG